MSLSAKVSKGVSHRNTIGQIENRSAPIIALVLAHLSAHSLGEKPDLRSIADTLNLSVSHLRHLIKRETGSSFGRQVKIVRLRRARLLLLETFGSVKEVMNQVGFSDHSHFSKDYKKEFGESPTQTRTRRIFPENVLKMSQLLGRNHQSDATGDLPSKRNRGGSICLAE